MRIAMVLLTGTLGVAFLIGCGSEKQLPDAVAVPTDDVKETGPVIPTISEEEAKKVVERCLKAATSGDAAKLDKLKSFRLTLSGSMQLPGAQGDIMRMESTRQIEYVWPNRARLEDTLQSKLVLPVVSGVRWPSVWVTQQQPDGNWAARQPSRAQERLFLTEFAANIGFPFLHPLADGKTIVYSARTIAVGNGTADVVHAAIPD